MIVFDANILIFAYDSGSSRHAKARAWVEEILSGEEGVGLPWQAISAFLRVMTNRRLPGSRFSSEQALRIVGGWLGQPSVRALAPGEQHWPLLRQMVIEGQTSGALVSDAQIAALTIEYGGVLHTADRDFARFPGLRWKNPLG
ncbi:MAG: Ribonuclease VapC [Candidatus Sulfotelmatobacter sp.]|nr:Ribonuclease VapC [Candidatus Sulfotelmatobacter sp.]